MRSVPLSYDELVLILQLLIADSSQKMMAGIEVETPMHAELIPRLNNIREKW